MPRGDEQINIRLSPEHYEALAAAAYVRGMKSPSELVRVHVEDLARELAREPAVGMARKAREMHEAEGAGRLRHLPRPPHDDQQAS